MAPRASLREYRAKRDFRRTDEPAGRRSATPSRRARFVIQEHRATAHHYDFRLEVNGILASWAVPKGPSLDPDEKRLAIRTEDHPLDYATYEGVIPPGQYGAGPVIVWDTGTYRNTTLYEGEPLAIPDAIARGHCTFELRGKKLAGGFSLTRMRRGPREQWLLVKHADEHADRRRKPVRSQPQSVLSGRTIGDVAASA